MDVDKHKQFFVDLGGPLESVGLVVAISVVIVSEVKCLDLPGL